MWPANRSSFFVADVLLASGVKAHEVRWLRVTPVDFNWFLKFETDSSLCFYRLVFLSKFIFSLIFNLSQFFYYFPQVFTDRLLLPPWMNPLALSISKLFFFLDWNLSNVHYHRLASWSSRYIDTSFFSWITVCICEYYM